MDSTSAHREALQTQHAKLEKELAEEQKRRVPDPVVISVLKKRKLKIKEELEHIIHV